MCVADKIPEGVSPLQASWRSLLVSRKVVNRKVCTEGSETTNFCTDGQEMHMRQDREGK
jgi:hypothetical protein